MRHTRIRDDLLRKYSGAFPERFAGDQFQPELIELQDSEVGGPAIRFYTNGIVDDFPGAGFAKVARREEDTDLATFGTNEVEIFEFKASLEENDGPSVARDPHGWSGCNYEMRFHPKLLRYFLFREVCYKTAVDEQDGSVTKSKTSRYARWAYMFDSPAAPRYSDEKLDAFHDRKWKAVASAETLSCPGGEKSGGKLRMYCAWNEDLSSKDYVTKLLDSDSHPASEVMLCQAPEGGFSCGMFRKCPYRLMWRSKKFDPDQTWSADFIEQKGLSPQSGVEIKTKNWKVAMSVPAMDNNQTHSRGRIDVPKITGQVSGPQSIRCRWLD